MLSEPVLDARASEGVRELLVSVDVDSENRLVTAREAAKILGVGDVRVRQLILKGALLARKQTGVNFVYLRSVLDRLKDAPAGGRSRTASV